MDHAVKVRSLPRDLEFPPELQSRIRFDAAMKQLVFHGFMCKADYDRLTRLHSDMEYQRAIDRLFQVSTDADSPQLRRFGRFLGVLAALCLLLAAIVWWQLLRDGSASGVPTQSPVPDTRRMPPTPAVLGDEHDIAAPTESSQPAEIDRPSGKASATSAETGQAAQKLHTDND